MSLTQDAVEYRESGGHAVAAVGALGTTCWHGSSGHPTEGAGECPGGHGSEVIRLSDQLIAIDLMGFATDQIC